MSTFNQLAKHTIEFSLPKAMSIILRATLKLRVSFFIDNDNFICSFRSHRFLVFHYFFRSQPSTQDEGSSRCDPGNSLVWCLECAIDSWPQIRPGQQRWRRWSRRRCRRSWKLRWRRRSRSRRRLWKQRQGRRRRRRRWSRRRCWRSWKLRWRRRSRSRRRLWKQRQGRRLITAVVLTQQYRKRD